MLSLSTVAAQVNSFWAVEFSGNHNTLHQSLSVRTSARGFSRSRQLIWAALPSSVESESVASCARSTPTYLLCARWCGCSHYSWSSRVCLWHCRWISTHRCSWWCDRARSCSWATWPDRVCSSDHVMTQYHPRKAFCRSCRWLFWWRKSSPRPALSLLCAIWAF